MKLPKDIISVELAPAPLEFPKPKFEKNDIGILYSGLIFNKN